MRRILLLAPVLCIACAPSGTRYFPLEVGHRWSYAVRGGFLSRVEDVQVVRSMSVAGTSGYEIRGPTGVSRLAWKGNVLVAESLPGMRFSPPLPMLDPSHPTQAMLWKGLMTSPTAVLDAEARIVPKAEKLTLGGRRYETLHVAATIRAEGRGIEIQTWFAPGIGILRQEQRSNDNLVRSLEYLAGP
ncbi:MAG TPA: hypothetical protein PLH94_00670 [Fimbriimonadaceae bacterium]|nr:hypothetical protein [Fimbriimonadaceae bacterium]